MRRAGSVFLLVLAAGCGCVTRRTPEPRHSDPKGFVLPNGEIQLESSLYKLDLLDAKLYPFRDVPKDPIGVCTNNNKEVVARKLAYRLSIGESQAQERAAEMSYYLLLQEASPAELMPIVHLRRHYKEGLLQCVIDLTNGKVTDTADESNLSILIASNFETETRQGYVLVDFMTHWCGPCKEMVPDLEKLSHEFGGKLRVGRLDVDRNRAVSERYNIKQFPTLMILKDGKEVSRLEKGSSYSELRAWIQSTLQSESS
jgi:thioredoxin 1